MLPHVLLMNSFKRHCPIDICTAPLWWLWLFRGAKINCPNIYRFMFIFTSLCCSPVLVWCFSQSLFTLSLIEEYLSKEKVPGTEECWMKNRSYYRKSSLFFHFVSFLTSRFCHRNSFRCSFIKRFIQSQGCYNYYWFWLFIPCCSWWRRERGGMGMLNLHSEQINACYLWRTRGGGQGEKGDEMFSC